MLNTVTNDGVTPSQPGWSVSVTTSTVESGAVLTVRRHYGHTLGSPMSKGDHHGRRFENSDEAFAFALERGYLRRYFTEPSLRARRVERARRPERRDV